MVKEKERGKSRGEGGDMQKERQRRSRGGETEEVEEENTVIHFFARDMVSRLFVVCFSTHF